ncbi:MAG: hypothetical protein ABI333_09490 [bacterium]
MQPFADLLGVLVDAGLLKEADAVRLRREAAASGRVQIRVLRESGLVGDDVVLGALKERLGLEVLDVSDENAVELEALRWLAQDVADAHVVLPVRVDGGTDRVLGLAMADPLSAHSIQTVERSSGFRVEPVLAEAGALTRAIHRSYGRITTKLIPRPAEPSRDRWSAWPSGGPGEPETQPAHRIEDEATPAQLVQALVNLLADKGILSREELVAEVKALLREDLDE